MTATTDLIDPTPEQVAAIKLQVSNARLIA